MTDHFFTGWDIGGVNTKVARFAGPPGSGERIHTFSRPFEIQRDPGALPGLLRELAQVVGAGRGDLHGITMTAELSQFFVTKREGVRFILAAAATAFSAERVRVFATDGEFLMVEEAERDPLRVAASNWAATAQMVARTNPNSLLVDIGSTTTDIIPIIEGKVAALGRTDPERLLHGELVYTGALRTPAEALVTSVPFHGGMASVSAEGFALIADAHLWRGTLRPEDYTVPTPDGRPATREFAGIRLARVICADREMVDAGAIDSIAAALASAQTERIARAILRVRERHPFILETVVCGVGEFIAVEAARRAGLKVVRLATSLGDGGARIAPAAAVALLLQECERAMAGLVGTVDGENPKRR